MTVGEVNEKISDINDAIEEVYIYWPAKFEGYYERPEPKAVKYLQEYINVLLNTEVVG